MIAKAMEVLMSSYSNEGGCGDISSNIKKKNHPPPNCPGSLGGKSRLIGKDPDAGKD